MVGVQDAFGFSRQNVYKTAMELLDLSTASAYLSQLVQEYELQSNT